VTASLESATREGRYFPHAVAKRTASISWCRTRPRQSCRKEARGRTRFLSDEERAALLVACEKSDWPALHALVLVAMTTGVRRGELIALCWNDLGLKAGRALVRDSKNAEQRTVPWRARHLKRYVR
jgi:integrase